MKILVLTPTYFPIMGGAEIGIFEIYRRLALKHEVKILTPWPGQGTAGDYGMEESAFSHSRLDLLRFNDRINLKSWPGHRLLGGLIPPFSGSWIRAALRAIRDDRPDLIHAFYALPTGLAAISAERRKKIPVVLSLIGRDIPGPDVPPFWGNYVRTVVRSISKTIFISEYCRRALFGADSDWGEVIPFGVDIKKFRPDVDGHPIRESLHIPRESKVLFALQRLDRWKRVDVLIEAMKSIVREMDAFLVIGGKGPENNRLREITQERGLSSRVIFAGYIKEAELPSYYAMSDLFVFHSTYETFGLALLQAMAAGKPIVTVNSTAIPELIVHNQNGLLVPPLDSEELARAAVFLLKNEAAMKSFSTEARKKAMAKYDWQSIADQYEKEFHRCLK
jgi:glycosyltransferase involved in cell wall biosynthesis